jgi:hypothetical protein
VSVWRSSQGAGIQCENLEKTTKWISLKLYERGPEGQSESPTAHHLPHVPVYECRWATREPPLMHQNSRGRRSEVSWSNEVRSVRYPRKIFIGVCTCWSCHAGVGTGDTSIATMGSPRRWRSELILTCRSTAHAPDPGRPDNCSRRESTPQVGKGSCERSNPAINWLPNEGRARRRHDIDSETSVTMCSPEDSVPARREQTLYQRSG